MRSILHLILLIGPLAAVLFAQQWAVTKTVGRTMEVQGISSLIAQLENEIRQSYERAQFGVPLR
jgi:hypothetical protein